MADGFPANVAQYMADNPPPPIEIWAENWAAYRVFNSLITQWRTGMNGPTGLDYTALKTVMDIHGVTDQQQMLEDIGIMEIEAIKIMRAKK